MRVTPRLRVIGLIAGTALVALALIFIARQQDVLQQAWQQVRRPAILPLILLPIAVLANITLSGVLFRLLLSRFGRVGWLEMQAVIAAATLANFVPLRPGLPGRLLYHRAVNRIPLLKSGRTVIEAAALSITVGSYLAIASVMSLAWEVTLWYPVIGPIPVLLLLMIMPSLRFWMLVTLVRFAEVMVWAVRYLCAFALIGAPVSPEAALAFACVSVVATMVPLFSNGLGLREWAIGLVAPLLTAHTLQIGLIAEIINRAAEITVVAIAGSISAAYLARRANNTSIESSSTQP